MERPEQDLSIPLFVVCIILMVSALIASIYFENTYMERHQGMNTMGTTTQSAASSLADVYPLYPEFAWNESESVVTKIEDLTLYNYQITSKPLRHVVDIKPVVSSFHDYYDTKLKSQGWNEGYINSSGLASSQWTYKKGMKYIILSYVYEQEKKYGGGPVQCPCSTAFTIVTGGNE